MSEHVNSVVTQDPWRKLKQHTDARIALGRCGVSLPMQEYLAFKLAHAKARDAVHRPIEVMKIMDELEGTDRGVLQLTSMVKNRMEYLTRPDKGRVLDQHSKEQLARLGNRFDLCVVVCDGLSAPAVNKSASSVVNGFLDIVDQTQLNATPVFLVTNGRVAIGDEICSLLGARMVVTLIGERPGLSSPDSLGAYITYKPAVGTTDEARNCISNIRPGGMSVAEAVKKIAYLVEQGFALGETGVRLKDKMEGGYVPLLSFMSGA